VLAGIRGDTLKIVDPAHHRFTFIHSREGFLAVKRLSVQAGGWLNVIGTFANGETVFGGTFERFPTGPSTCDAGTSFGMG